MIVKPSDFQGEVAIGQIEHDDVKERVNIFIEEYEPTFLTQLLGKELYQELKEGVEEFEEKYIQLSDKVKPMCINYIYYWYQRDNISASTGIGENEPLSDNADIVSPATKMVHAWNKIAKLSRELVYCFDKSTYPSFKPNMFSEIFRPINTFGL